MRCPRCHTILQKGNIEEKDISLDVETCSTCEGSWFDAGKLEQLEGLIKPVLVEIKSLPSEEVQSQPLYCPVCEDGDILMVKSHHFRDHSVTMDRCPKCNGIWLDKGELEAIQQEGLLGLLLKSFKFR